MFVFFRYVSQVFVNVCLSVGYCRALCANQNTLATITDRLAITGKSEIALPPRARVREHIVVVIEARMWDLVYSHTLRHTRSHQIVDPI